AMSTRSLHDALPISQAAEAELARGLHALAVAVVAHVQRREVALSVAALTSGQRAAQPVAAELHGLRPAVVHVLREHGDVEDRPRAVGCALRLVERPLGHAAQGRSGRLWAQRLPCGPCPSSATRRPPSGSASAFRPGWCARSTAPRTARSARSASGSACA